MTNQTSDPIAEIKRAEEDAQRKIIEVEKNMREKLAKLEAELNIKTEELEKDLREKGTKKLEAVKIEASELLKTKMATLSGQQNKIAEAAKSKTKDGIALTIETFIEHTNPFRKNTGSNK